MPAGYDGGSPLLARRQASDLDLSVPSGGRFSVELKPGETTIVSWRNLLKEHQHTLPCSSSEAPPDAHPALEARIAPQVSKDIKFFHPVSRLSSVIERIERLYQGDSSDNELNECVEDDKYDTEDSFIDDTALDSYFSVDKAKLKHKGFFVNKGALEQEAESLASPLAGTNKVKRKGLKKCKELQVACKESTSAKKVKADLKESFGPSVRSFEASEAKKVKGKELGVFSCHTDGKVFMGRNSSSKDKTSKEILLHKHGLDGSSEGKAKFLQNHQKLADIQGIRNETEQRAVKVESFKDKQKTLVAAKKVDLPGENLRSPSAVLEKAFLELENEVTEVRSPSILGCVSEGGKRSYLPRSIKQKLAKVARLAIKKGGSTEKLFKRLHGILGHLVQEATLKRLFKSMLDLGSSAIQEKENRLREIKVEVAELVKSRVRQLQSEDVSPRRGGHPQISCFERLSKNGRYQWDHATEDKICILCERYIEDVDEDKGLHLRKLYAEVWLLLVDTDITREFENLQRKILCSSADRALA